LATILSHLICFVRSSLAPFLESSHEAWLLQLLCFTVFLASILTSTCSGAIPDPAEK